MTTISSLLFQVRASARDRANVSEVMFWPKTIVCGIVGAQKIGQAAMGLGQQAVAFARRGEAAAVVGVGVRQVMADGLDHPLRRLRAARAVEEHRRPLAHAARQRRELAAAMWSTIAAES